ncbi:MAG: hypothetical protein NVSMB65_20080 [Chloroflexota bacterium]
MFPFDPSKQHIYEQYARAHETGDHSGIDHDQMLGHVQQFMEHAPPQVQQQVFAQYFQQLSPEQRQQFVQQMGQATPGGVDPNNPQQMAQGLQQMGPQPSLLQKILGMASGQGGGVPAQSGGMGGLLSNPMAKAALVGVAGMAAKHLLGGGRGSGMGGGFFGGQQGYGGGWMGDRDGGYEVGGDRDGGFGNAYTGDDGADRGTDGGDAGFGDASDGGDGGGGGNGGDGGSDG